MSCARPSGFDAVWRLTALNPSRLGRRALGRRALCRWLLGSAVAAVLGGVASASAQTANPQASDPSPVDPDLAARFRVSLTPRGGPPQVQHWQLRRSQTEISWIKGDGLEDIWRRDRSGIRLLRVLRAERHLIDYPAGELRALQVAPDWQELGSLFAEPDLPLLHRESPARPGQPVRWAGRIGAEQVDLLWDAAARLPLRLARRSPAGQVLFERTALHPIAPADWPAAGAGTGDFQRLDAADFGDMADNPVVQKARALDQRAGWRRAHRD